MNNSNTYEIEGWAVHPELYLLKNHKSELQLQPRLMRLLDYFLRHPNQIIVKDDLLEYVWEGRVVTENLLTKSISELRKLLKLHFNNRLQIETLRNVGYRLQTDFPVKLSDAMLINEPIAKPIVKPRIINRIWYVPVFIIVSLFTYFIYAGLFNTPEKSWGIKYQKITSLEGLELNPAVSADGKNIAFGWRKESKGLAHIYVRPIEGSTARKLSTSNALEYSPLWTNDGQYVVYIRKTEPRQYKLIKSSIIGDNEIELAALSFLWMDQMCWTADQKSLLFTGQQTTADSRAIFQFDLTRQEVKQLTRPPAGLYGDIHPTQSADTSKIAFVRAALGKSVFSNAAPAKGLVLEVDKSNGRLDSITSIDQEINSFLYFPALNQYLIWVTEQLGAYTIIGISAEGKQSIIGHTNHGLPLNASMMYPDKICYEYWQSDVDFLQFNILDEPTMLSAPQAFLKSTSWDWGLSFATQVARAAFFSQRSGYSEIWLTDTNNATSLQQLTQLESPLLKTLALSPNGQYIVFSSVKNNQTDLFLLQSNGQQLEKISQGSYDVAAPEWSSDGQNIYYSSNVSGDWQLYQYSLKNAQHTQLTTEGGFRALPAPKNNALLYFVKYKKDGLWQLDLTNNLEKLAAPLDNLKHSTNWAITDKGIYHISWKKENTYLHYYDFNIQQDHSIQRLENMIAGIPSIAVAPDFKTIFIASGRGLNSDILSIELQEEK